MDSGKSSHLSNSGIILASGMACAFVSMIVALAVGQATLPPSDGAYGLGVTGILRDPFVSGIAFPVTLVFGAFGSVCAIFLLARTDLRRSIPTVAAVTIGTTAAFSVMTEIIAAPVGLVSGILSMAACRVLWPLKRETGQSMFAQSGASGHRGG